MDNVKLVFSTKLSITMLTVSFLAVWITGVIADARGHNPKIDAWISGFAALLVLFLVFLVVDAIVWLWVLW